MFASSNETGHHLPPLCGANTVPKITQMSSLYSLYSVYSLYSLYSLYRSTSKTANLTPKLRRKKNDHKMSTRNVDEKNTQCH